MAERAFRLQILEGDKEQLEAKVTEAVNALRDRGIEPLRHYQPVKRGNYVAFLEYEEPVLQPEPASQPPEPDSDKNLHKKFEELERQEIIDALAKAKGNKARAAEILGKNRSTLYFYLKKYGLE